MCTTLPEVLITVMGIEKVIPRLAGPRGLPAAAAALLDRRADEPVHLAVDRASRPATGRRSSISCCSTTAAPTCSPTRSAAQALHCIRCSACLNVCPVYERTGGHAYGSVYPGPIGAILTPAARRLRARHIRCPTPRRSAAPATRSARSRSTSRRSSSTCAAGSSSDPADGHGTAARRVAMRRDGRACSRAGAATRPRSALGRLGQPPVRARRRDQRACRERSAAGRMPATSGRCRGQTFRDWWERGTAPMSSRARRSSGASARRSRDVPAGERPAGRRGRTRDYRARRPTPRSGTAARRAVRGAPRASTGPTVTRRRRGRAVAGRRRRALPVARALRRVADPAAARAVWLPVEASS